jgi:hypothetical protein
MCNKIRELGPADQMHRGQHLWPILIAVAATDVREFVTTQNTLHLAVQWNLSFKTGAQYLNVFIPQYENNVYKELLFIGKK